MRSNLHDLRQTHTLGEDTYERYVLPETCPPLTATRMRLAGLSDAGRSYSMVRVRPDFEHMLVCIGGEGRVLVDEEWRPCRTGQAYLGPPGPSHAFRTVGRKRWQFCWVIYQPPKPGALPVIGGDRPRLIDVDPRGLWAAIEGAHREANGPAELAMLERYVGLIEAHVARIVDPLHERDPLWRLWAAVTGDLAADWSLERLADHACFSATHVRRLCLRQTGRTPVAHVTHLRMARAMILLESTTMKVAAVAQAVGYANPFAFSTAFRRSHGVSPAGWRSGTVGK